MDRNIIALYTKLSTVAAEYIEPAETLTDRQIADEWAKAVIEADKEIKARPSILATIPDIDATRAEIDQQLAGLTKEEKILLSNELLYNDYISANTATTAPDPRYISIPELAREWKQSSGSNTPQSELEQWIAQMIAEDEAKLTAIDNYQQRLYSLQAALDKYTPPQQRALLENMTDR